MFTEEDYKMAIYSQGACNLKGLIKSFNEILSHANVSDVGTEEINTHPICRLFAEQIYHLTRKTDYFDAHHTCEIRSNMEEVE